MRSPTTPLAALGLLLLPSCGVAKMYEGPARPDSELAVIQQGGSIYGHVSVARIDGEWIGAFNTGARVLPGKHVVTVEFREERQEDVVRVLHRDLELEAEAGETYRVMGGQKILEGSFVAWIEDIGGTVVAGAKPGKQTER